MRFLPTAIEGAKIIELEGSEDVRGYFSRTFCEKEFLAADIEMHVVQANLSRNPRKGTLRGLHYQEELHSEPKVVQCVRGRLFDVAIDLRPNSRSYLRWASIELSADANRIFYIPRGCAHGFLTLADQTDIVYLMGAPFVPGSARGVRWDDPTFGIDWPASPIEISERDASYPAYLKAEDET